ncbi:MAG: hypothetical protein KGR26_07825 [Cyanobacteria bacterium REEB65]|nr:hypothetical protein [Cyanobacteria bacterium REEB65]
MSPLNAARTFGSPLGPTLAASRPTLAASPPLPAADPPSGLADSLARTLQTGDQLQGEAQKLWGQTAAGKAILDNPIMQGEQALTTTVLPAAKLAAAMSDLAGAQTQAVSDLARLESTLANSHATAAMKVQAAAQATASASAFVQKQQALISSLDSADEAYLQHDPTYAALLKPAQPAFQLLGKINSTYLKPIVGSASAVGSVAGIVVGGFALPGLVQGTVASAENLDKELRDPKATADQKLQALAATTRGGAAILYSANGVESGMSSLLQMLAGVRSLEPALGALKAEPMVQVGEAALGTAFRVLLPIADIGTMVADGVSFEHTVTDPQASTADKAKAFLAVALDTFKVATYFFPATEGIRMAYMLASFGQMGFALAGFSKTAIPEAITVAGSLLDDLANPAATWKRLRSGFDSIAQKIQGALGLRSSRLTIAPLGALPSSAGR